MSACGRLPGNRATGLPLTSAASCRRIMHALATETRAPGARTRFGRQRAAWSFLSASRVCVTMSRLT
jgi:hypothetical protein